jgi:hypothetical protein
MATPPPEPSTATTTAVAVVAAVCVVVVASGVAMIKKRQTEMARTRVQPFNAETGVTDTTTKPMVHGRAAPTTYDGFKGGDDQWATVHDV